MLIHIFGWPVYFIPYAGVYFCRITMKNITVVGAGIMGHGIAHVFAIYGFQVCLIDLNTSILNHAKGEIIRNLQRQLKKAIITRSEMESTLSRISYNKDLGDGTKDADLVIEAIVEHEATKKAFLPGWMF